MTELCTTDISAQLAISALLDLTKSVLVLLVDTLKLRELSLEKSVSLVNLTHIMMSGVSLDASVVDLPLQLMVSLLPANV